MKFQNDSRPRPGQRFWMLLKPDKAEITNLYIYAIFNGLIYLSLPLGIQSIINLIQGGQISTSWIILVAIVLVALIISGFLGVYQMRITENLQQKIFSRAAFEFTYRLPRLAESVKNKFYLPELSNRFFEAISLQKGLSKILVEFSAAIVQIAFGIIVLSFYHPFFILYISLCFVIVYFLFRLTVKKGLTSSLEESMHKYKLVFWLQETARAGNTFKTAGYPDHTLKKTNDHVGNYIRARESHFDILVKQYRLLILFKVLIAGGLLAIGGILVIEQEMNIGQFVAAEIIILLMMSSVEKLILNMSTIYDTLTALEKIGFVTDMPLESSKGTLNMELCDENGIQVKLENVCIHNPDNPDVRYSPVNAIIQPGKRAIIDGKDEDSKEILFKILSGNSGNYNGLISFCGISLHALSFEQMKSRIGVYDENDVIFSGTVFENIALGRPGIGLKEVIQAAKMVSLDSIIQSRKEGYDTILSINNTTFSVTSRKKILLARAIVHHPKLLLVNFDRLPEEPKLRKSLAKKLNALHDCTLIAITSDPDLIDSDKIILNTELI